MRRWTVFSRNGIRSVHPFDRRAILVVLIAVILSTADARGGETEWWRGNLVWDAGACGVLPTADERRDQEYIFTTAAYEIPVLDRYTVGFMVRPVMYRTRETTIQGIAAGFRNRIWRSPNREHGLYILWQVGGIYLDRRIPGLGSNLNFTSEINFGIEWKDPSIFLQLGVQHMSNGYLREPNIGMNGVGIVLGTRVGTLRPRKER